MHRCPARARVGECARGPANRRAGGASSTLARWPNGVQRASPAEVTSRAAGRTGEVSERLKEPVLKTGDPQGSMGSNPILSDCEKGPGERGIKGSTVGVLSSGVAIRTGASAPAAAKRGMQPQAVLRTKPQTPPPAWYDRAALDDCVCPTHVVNWCKKR